MRLTSLTILQYSCIQKHKDQVCFRKKELPVIFIATLGRLPVTFSFGSRGSSVMRHLSNWIVKLVGCSKCIGVTVLLVKASSHVSSPTATRTYTIHKDTNQVLRGILSALKIALWNYQHKCELMTQSSIFLDVLLCDNKVYRHFREMHCLHLHGWRISQESNLLAT
jgi:hypothetical protein